MIKNEMYIGTNIKHKSNPFKCLFITHNSTMQKFLDDFLNSSNIKPLFLYENLHLDETRKTISKDTSDLSGIYLIFNNITGDYYVGSASTNKFYSRFSRHLINLTGSKVLKNAVRKYKLSNFAFLLLEKFTELVNKQNNKKLLDIEDFYIKSLLPNYNILTEAGSSFGYKQTEMDRIKMKTNYSIDRHEKISSLNKGKTFSEETIGIMKQKALARETRHFTNKGL